MNPHPLVDKQAKDLDYQTPQRVLAPVRDYCGGRIGLDPATTECNPTGASVFFDGQLGLDGLTLDWSGSGVVFVNPPYGKALRLWLAKIVAQADRNVEILALLPVSRTEQGYMQAVMKTATAVCWVLKRVAFLRPSTLQPARGNPHASALWGFNVDRRRFTAAFAGLGLVQHFYQEGLGV